jgi:hypothetical protein
MMSEYTQIAYIAINTEGEYKVDYVSYATKEATLQTAKGTNLQILIQGIEKNKDTYIKEI